MRNYNIILIISGLLFFLSCRTEEIIVINPPVENAITKDSEVAKLMQRTTQLDGSIDNIIDKANCLTVRLPVKVIVNGGELLINDASGYQDIENIFDAIYTDNDTLEIVFPIQVITNKYETMINLYFIISRHCVECN